ncbi:sulfatase-like hydrolase/transferase [Phreatobacter sp. AB_2022a]|uniref:sulfatase-like hydrolase/transferase n=1 Tax=Phreatobacter sp. AB_2022a TaxID=3003134 RepID=UPI002287184C|nr:sulfatase-like hydrolase/transferase [Phreatobacter sp. AB_2022a]MCZ0733645.1 sulfatase-like hydrolase/transferase [Phreatobacter sp. AB_2022a]
MADTDPQTTKNVLFIMCDQLRFDYLGCAGHARLETPNIDALARRGVRFSRAYVQSPVCGPSRMSFYTGRYMRSHGSNWNNFPLRVGEPTLGEHLKRLGVRNVLVGKTHMKADDEGMARLGIDPNSIIGVEAAQCGFEPYERDDGLHPTRPGADRPRYDGYLAAEGYAGPNPWEDFANSGEAADGTRQNGWLLAHGDKPARVSDEQSETPYMTRRAMDFIREARADGRPWCLHLSYIKPHWPYIAPAPYHDMFGPDDVQPAIRSERERQDPHPVYGAFMDLRVSRNFAREEVRRRVIPAYMGLIKQIDDQLGLLFRFLDEEGLSGSTMIVFTSDHGDYLGDHWLGEKDLFHEMSVKVPLIIADPAPEADAARGTVSDVLVEAIDLAATFIDYFGGTVPRHIVEGRSLTPHLQGQRVDNWRSFVVSEYDYSMQDVRTTLKRDVSDCRLFMLFDGRFKYIHAPGFRPMLYDLDADPHEFRDLGGDPGYEAERARLKDLLLGWALTDHNRITMPDARIAAYGPATQLKSGILIGYWDEAEVERARRQYGL